MIFPSVSTVDRFGRRRELSGGVAYPSIAPSVAAAQRQSPSIRTLPRAPRRTHPGQRYESLGHQRVPLVRHLHPAQRVTLRGVEPGGYDDEVGIERFGDGVDDEVKSGEIIGVAEPFSVHGTLTLYPTPSPAPVSSIAPVPG